MLFRYFGIAEASPMRKFRSTEYLVRNVYQYCIPVATQDVEHLLAFLWVDASEFIAVKVVLYTHNTLSAFLLELPLKT